MGATCDTVRRQLRVIQGSVLAGSQPTERKRANPPDKEQFVGNSSRRCSLTWRNIMTTFHRPTAGLVASGVFALGLFCASAP